MTPEVGGFKAGDKVAFVSPDQDPAFWPRISAPHIVVALDLATHKVGLQMSKGSVMFVPPEDLMHWVYYRTTMELAVDRPHDIEHDTHAEELARTMNTTRDALMHSILTGKRR